MTLAWRDRTVYVFFFSSRRRHTRCYRDWSSDVCSSDLAGRREHVRPRDCMMETADSSEIDTCMNARCGQQLRVPAGEILQVTCPTCGASFTYRPPRTAGGSKTGLSPESQRKAWVMGELMLMIARESMTLLKRN